MALKVSPVTMGPPASVNGPIGLGAVATPIAISPVSRRDAEK